MTIFIATLVLAVLPIEQLDVMLRKRTINFFISELSENIDKVFQTGENTEYSSPGKTRH